MSGQTGVLAQVFPALYVLPFTPLDFDRHRQLASSVVHRLPDPLPYGTRGRAAEFLAGRAAVALAFRAVGWTGQIEANADFGYLEVKTPSGTMSPARYVNLSHTAGLAVAILGFTPVGVDVERIDRDASRVIQRVATAREMAAVRSGDVPIEGKPIPPEVVVWSAKEAVSKAIGLGIKFGMRAFEVDFRSPLPWPVKLSIGGPLMLNEPAVCPVIVGDYLISVCSERSSLLRGIARLGPGPSFSDGKP